MIGTRLGPYEIIEEIGKGGMATVYRAFQPSIGRFVAVKVIHRAIASDQRALERFQREARLIARLEHPHLLPVYDYDGTHEPPYIVMRYLEGGTLKDVLDQGRLPLVDISYLMRQVASALDYAHRQGVIHRDIKPSNIMIDQDGNAFLMDFGIARLAASTSEGLTQTGFAVGTPGYMAPEQGMGLDNIDQRADIYSLGVLVYQMLTGQMPFKAETPLAIVMKHINEPVPSARAIDPDLPESLDAALMRSMAKKPDDRFASATDLSDEITRAIGRMSQPSLRPEALRTAARRAVEEIQHRRAARQAEIDATMLQFEQSRAPLTRNRPDTGQTRTDPVARAAEPASAGATPLQTPQPDLDDNQPTIITPNDQRAVPPRTPTGGTPAAPPQSPPPPPAQPEVPPPPPPGRSRLPLILAGAAVLVVIGIVGVLALGGGGGGESSQALTATVQGGTEIVQATAPPATSTTAPSATAITPLPASATAQPATATPLPASPTDTTLPPSATAAATEAPAATSTLTVTPSATPTFSSTATFTATFTASPSDTPPPTLTATPATPIAVAGRQLVARLGPGSQYPELGIINADEVLTVLGISDDTDWLQVELPDGQIGWLRFNAQFLTTFGDLRDVPIAEAPTDTPVPTDTPTETPIPTDTPTETPIPTDTPTQTPIPTDTPTQTPIPTDTPTETPVPTETPIPTDTPTETPIPTDTPTDTPTPTATPAGTPELLGIGTCEGGMLQFTVANTGTGASPALGYLVSGPTGSLGTGILQPIAPGESLPPIIFEKPEAGLYTLFAQDGAVTITASCGEAAPSATPTPSPTVPAPVGFPYLQDFEGEDPIARWDYDSTVWQVVSDGSEHYLQGQGSLRAPAVLMGSGEQPWTSSDSILINFRVYLDPQQVGARVVFNFNPATGEYRVLEMYPGLVSLKRNSPSPDVFNPQTERVLRSTGAPLSANRWANITIWQQRNHVNVYLDDALLISLDDTATPSISAGQILLQVTSTTRPIRFDDFLLQQPSDTATNFDAGVVPDNWRVNSDDSLVSVENDGQTSYLRLENGGSVTLVNDTPLQDFTMLCSVWSENGGYRIRLRDSDQGAIQLTTSGGNLTIVQDGAGGQTAIDDVANFYNRNRWELIYIEFVGGHLRIDRDGETRWEGDIVSPPASGEVSFSAPGSADIFRIDYCVTAPAALSSNLLERPFYALRDLANSRPWRLLRSDFDDNFDEPFRTDDYWIDGTNAAGTFTNDPGASEHRQFLRMAYTGRPTWRLMRDVMGVEVFESGNSLARSTDVYATAVIRFPQGAGVAWLGVRTAPTITGADVGGYFLMLRRNEDGSTDVIVRQHTPTGQQVLFEGPAPLPEGASAQPGWIPVEVLALDNQIGYFVNGVLVYAQNDARVLGGTAALGVGENTTADFDSFVIRDTSPHDES